MKILIVDDEEHTTDILSAYLSKIHRVTCYNDPVKALNHYVENQDYDVVITDFIMPQLRGDALIEMMFDLNSDQCFIVISGFFTCRFINILKKSSAYIKMFDKPINMKKLDHELETIYKLKVQSRE